MRASPDATSRSSSENTGRVLREQLGAQFRINGQFSFEHVAEPDMFGEFLWIKRQWFEIRFYDCEVYAEAIIPIQNRRNCGHSSPDLKKILPSLKSG